MRELRYVCGESAFEISAANRVCVRIPTRLSSPTNCSAHLSNTSRSPLGRCATRFDFDYGGPCRAEGPSLRCPTPSIGINISAGERELGRQALVLVADALQRWFCHPMDRMGRTHGQQRLGFSAFCTHVLAVESISRAASDYPEYLGVCPAIADRPGLEPVSTNGLLARCPLVLTDLAIGLEAQRAIVEYVHLGGLQDPDAVVPLAGFAPGDDSLPDAGNEAVPHLPQVLLVAGEFRG
jgi:hypothetical protein